MATTEELILSQLSRLEDKLNKLEEFLVYSDKGLPTLALKIQTLQSDSSSLDTRLMDIESRMAKIEYRTTRQTENIELRQFAEFIHGFPLGWTGLWWSFVITVAAIDVLLDFASLTKILNKLFGVS